MKVLRKFKNISSIFVMLPLLSCILCGCTIPSEREDCHDNILVHHSESINLEELFSQETPVNNVDTKYSILYKNGLKRKMYVFSSPVREYTNTSYSLVKNTINKAGDTTYESRNNETVVKFEKEKVSIGYGSDLLSLCIDNVSLMKLTSVSNTALEYEMDVIEYRGEGYYLFINTTCAGISLEYIIETPLSEHKIPLIFDNYEYENEDAGYVIFKRKDVLKYIFYQTMIRDSNDSLYVLSPVSVEKNGGDHVLTCSIPEDAQYPIHISFNIDCYSDNMFYDSTAYEAQSRLNSLMNDISVFDTRAPECSGITYMKFNIKSFTPNNPALLDSVYLNVYAIHCLEDTIIEVYSVRRDWCSWTLNWKNQPRHNEKIGEFTLDTKGWYQLDVTEYVRDLIANDYYNLTDNTLMFKIKDATIGYAVFSSADNKNYPIYFEVNYKIAE